MKNLMVLGTSSGAGKSLVTAAFCRWFSNRGLKVAPFKAQNMSNNSYVTEDGGEIGRAQAVQAECARVTPEIHMNPVLLKPSGDNKSQAVVQGRSIGNFAAREYYGQREKLETAIRSSYESLKTRHDLLVIEGAGSPVEINLKQYDLVNMSAAAMADARCVLVADIDRGGVFASVLGTLDLLEPVERERIDGVIINKFRGDRSLFEEGIAFIESRSGKKVWGVLPYDREIRLPEEDALDVRAESQTKGRGLDIAVLLLERLSNFTDFDPLAAEPGVCLRYVADPSRLGCPDLVIIPGTKATVSDYRELVRKGFRKPLMDYVSGGGRVLGICGGYQMMGRVIRDAAGVEAVCSETEGFGFFDMATEFQAEKVLKQVEESVNVRIFNADVRGMLKAYEIHMGVPIFHRAYAPFGSNGAVSDSGRLLGTYFHGLFDSGDFRAAFLDALARDAGKPGISSAAVSYDLIKDTQYNKLAQFLSEHLSMSRVCQSLGIGSLQPSV